MPFLGFQIPAEGRTPLALSILPDASTAIMLADLNNDNSVVLAVSEAGRPRLTLKRDPSIAFSLEADSDGQADVWIADETFCNGTRILVANDGPGIKLLDRPGHTRLSLIALPEETYALLFDGTARIRSSMHDRPSDTSLLFLDRKENTRLELRRDVNETRIRLLGPDANEQHILR